MIHGRDRSDPLWHIVVRQCALEDPLLMPRKRVETMASARFGSNGACMPGVISQGGFVVVILVHELIKNGMGEKFTARWSR